MVKRYLKTVKKLAVVSRSTEGAYSERVGAPLCRLSFGRIEDVGGLFVRRRNLWVSSDRNP